eukprot:jgi/Chlat1/2784/Chrsp187S02951
MEVVSMSMPAAALVGTSSVARPPPLPGSHRHACSSSSSPSSPHPSCSLPSSSSASLCCFPLTSSLPSRRLRRLTRPTRPAHSTTTTASQSVNELPAALQKIVRGFQMVPDPMQRYKQLLFYATKLKPLPAEDHNDGNKVTGCVSQVWVVPRLEDGKVYFSADSDSQLTKGLAALLVEGLSGASPEEVLRITPDFITDLGLKQSLTPSRNNGFLNMLKLMQKKTLELSMQVGASS